MQEKNILFQNQFGFRKNNSTTFALIQITEKIKETIDNKIYGCGIFIDLCKAFDTVNQDILLRKLEHYGIRGKAQKVYSNPTKPKKLSRSKKWFDKDCMNLKKDVRKLGRQKSKEPTNLVLQEEYCVKLKQF